MEVAAICLPNIPIVFVGKRVAAKHVKLARWHDEVRRICIESSRVSRTHLRFNRARSAEIEAAQDAIVTFRQTLFEVVTKTEIESQFSRDTPVVLEEEPVIDRLDRVVDRIIDLTCVTTGTGCRNTEQERSDVAAKNIS